jgi:hypothetical protein
VLEEVAPEEAPTRTWEARQASVREFRPRRTLVALCVAVALTAAGVLAVAELALIRLRGRAHFGERTGLLWPAPETIGGPGVVGPDRLLWSDHAVLWTGAVIAAFGVLLLLSALLPGRTRHVPLGADHPDFLSGLTRSGMRRMLVTTAAGVPGIDRATVRLRGRFRPRAVVRVTTNYRNPGRFAEQVREAVQARLEEIDPVRVPRVVVRLRWRDK